jgi:hypothetical protein
MNALSAMSLAFACVYQDAKFRDGKYGQRMAQDNKFLGWDAIDQTPLAQCLRKHKWLSEAFCRDVDNLSSTKDAAGVFERHAEEMPIIERALDYLQETLFGRTREVGCPEIAPTSVVPRNGHG